MSRLFLDCSWFGYMELFAVALGNRNARNIISDINYKIVNVTGVVLHFGRGYCSVSRFISTVLGCAWFSGLHCTVIHSGMVLLHVI